MAFFQEGELNWEPNPASYLSQLSEPQRLQKGDKEISVRTLLLLHFVTNHFKNVFFHFFYVWGISLLKGAIKTHSRKG